MKAQFGIALYKNPQDVIDYVYTFGDVPHTAFPFGFRGTRIKTDIHNCSCRLADTRVCQCDHRPCICVKRGAHDFAYRWIPATAPIAMDAQEAMYQQIFSIQSHDCKRHLPTSTKASVQRCGGTYRIRYDTLSFTGNMFFLLFDDQHHQRHTVAVSTHLSFASFSLVLASVVCHGSNHYIAYSRFRNKDGSSRWLYYDDLDDGGTVRLAVGDRPWELGRRRNVRVAIYVPHTAVTRPVAVDLVRYRAFNRS